MTEVPSRLYRSVCCEEAYVNHREGKLWFRSYSYFRRIEGNARDELEGIGGYIHKWTRHIDVSDDSPVQPAYLMCFSQKVESTRDFGSWCLELRNPHELLNRVKSSLPEDITTVEWRKVEYHKTMEIEKEMSVTDGWNRKYYCKPEEFIQETEWRLIIQFVHTFRPFNETMKFHVKGKLWDIFDLISGTKN